MMSKVSNSLRALLSTTQTRLVFALTIAVFVIILAVSLTSYYTSKSVLQSELSEMHHQLLSDKMNFIEDYIKDTDSTAIKMALHSGVYGYLSKGEQITQTEIRQLIEYLKYVVINSPIIESAYIFNADEESFVSYPMGYSSRFSTFPDSDWVSVGSELEEKTMLVKSRTAAGGSGKNGTNEITYFRKIVVQGEMKGILALNFNKSELFAQMRPSAVSKIESAQYILDSEGNLVYQIGDAHAEPSDIYVHTQQLRDQRYDDVKLNGESLLLTYNPSPLTDWRYVSIASQDDILANSKKIRSVVLLVSLIMLVLGAWLIIQLHAVTFKPIRRLHSLLKNYEREENSLDLGKLENITVRLLRAHEDLSQQIRHTKAEASSKFVQDIFMGNLSGRREMEARWSQYFKEWTNRPLRVVLISIDRYSEWADKWSDNDQFLYKYAMNNIAEELLAPSYRSVSVDLGKDKLALVLQPSVDKEEPMEAELSQILPMLQDILQTKASIGISHQAENVMKLQRAYYEAENALSYRLYKGYGTVITFEEVASHERTDSVEDESIVSALLQAVESGSKEQATRMLSKLEEQMRTEGWYPSEVTGMLTHIRQRLMKLEVSKEGADPEEVIQIRQLYTLDLPDMMELLYEYTSRLADHFASLAVSREAVMVQQMIDFMTRHLDGNVGVQEIASSVHISVSLASQLFKQETGETIHDYFTKLRVEKAGELLIETDYKLAEIARMVGYQHENSFIRVFRKLKDITPGKYREHMKYKKYTV
ncbi:helix-turn-helix domain-containing protein [Paenibacillus urinalis]|uniref:Helix-turn-helix domain-containing protein n=1 Tax=Paenibacillus urinalis TaxID=521520 RepID=A0ABY7XBL0_9BACL|nr:MULTISPECIES: helix-turn-helix domain-containing protein [Paenibacillus]WDH99537.1 helix-turn-helix domain-containing protein [Paenibacillus urinalis]WDI03169.1 helix-turn-helix domain-containing protein [Paenibacillus urinalis]GAK41876.1 hypothetical protein TCA2_4368 [Paenibacillus sp. TCA20]